MTAPNIHIETVDDAAPLEVVELVAGDVMSARIVSALPNDGVGARVVLRQGPAYTGETPSPLMVVVLGDLRGGTPGRMMLDMRSRSALSIAVAVVESLASAAQLERAFDCIVPVLARADVDAAPVLTRAVSAVTAFATANRVSIPVDEMYPFFVRAGRATWACGVDADTVRAAEMALAGAGVASKGRPRRILLHVESSQHDYMTDLRLAAEVAWRTPNVERLELAVSARGVSAKRVSVIAVDGR